MPTNVVQLDTRKLDEIIAAASEKTRRYIIADGTDYGVFVELGTTRMTARPCLIPAFESKTQGIERALGQAVEAGVSLDDVLGKVAFDIQRDYQANVPVDTGNLKNSIHTEIE